MDFFLVGVLLWLLIAVSGLLFIWGIMKKNWIILLISGFCILIPSMIFSTVDGWVKLFVVLPLISFAIAYYFYKRTRAA